MMHHQFGRTHLRIATRNRELHALVLTNGASENIALACVIGRFFNKPFGVADAFGGNQYPFGIHTRKYVSKALAFFTDQRGSGDAHIVEENFGC